MNRSALCIDADVNAALANDEPVVALESTLIAHGMPYPENLQTAQRLTQEIRARGATPATIAIIDGQLKVGLNDEQLETLSRHASKALKVSRRDIPFAMTNRDVIGATTVAATMIVAELAGIQIFATGGIGGVHRGAAETFDISADLQELGRTNVAVVCAGAKSILDLELTREYLETLGVPVIGYQTDQWPAFYTRGSRYAVDYRAETAAEIAQLLHTKWRIPITGGALVCAPIPQAHALAEDDVEKAIAEALDKMRAKGISGKDSTPFLLAEIAASTSGTSLKSNIALVLNNARVAAEVAAAYAALDSV